jgi:hypothetical protein
MMAPFTGGCGCGAFGAAAADSGLTGVAITTRSQEDRGPGRRRGCRRRRDRDSCVKPFPPLSFFFFYIDGQDSSSGFNRGPFTVIVFAWISSLLQIRSESVREQINKGICYLAAPHIFNLVRRLTKLSDNDAGERQMISKSGICTSVRDYRQLHASDFRLISEKLQLRL